MCVCVCVHRQNKFGMYEMTEGDRFRPRGTANWMAPKPKAASVRCKLRLCVYIIVDNNNCNSSVKGTRDKGGANNHGIMSMHPPIVISGNKAKHCMTEHRSV